MALLRRAATSISLAPWQAPAHLRSAITLRWTRLLVPIDVPDVPNALCANLVGAANSPGSVMAKMIDAQSIVVASTATRWFNHEGDVLRYVFFQLRCTGLPGRAAGDVAGFCLAVHADGGALIWRDLPAARGGGAPAGLNHPGWQRRWRRRHTVGVWVLP